MLVYCIGVIEDVDCFLLVDVIYVDVICCMYGEVVIDVVVVGELVIVV